MNREVIRIKVKMRRDIMGADRQPNNVPVPTKRYEKNKEYEVGEDLGLMLCKAGYAEHKGEIVYKSFEDWRLGKKMQSPVPENKMQPKPAKTKKRKYKKKKKS